MIRTKILTSSFDEIPTSWPFEYYLHLPEKLYGQNLKMKSIFNPKDKNPSFCIYFDSKANKYKFKDFSTGHQGDCVNLVCILFNLKSRSESYTKIIEDYNQYILNNGEIEIREFKEQSKYKVTEFVSRSWNILDEKFWSNFHISSKILEKYNVYPLELYKMVKNIDNEEVKELIISGNYIYGYFRKDGSLYKVYQPKIKDTKFIKVKDYTQGLDQLTMTKDYLVICSSLKDLMAFEKLNFKNAEAIAPDSENTLIVEHVITSFKNKYKNVCTLFDNDEAGIKAMKKYEDRYGLPYVILDMSKDLSDSIRDHGINKVRETLMPLLSNKLNPKTK